MGIDHREWAAYLLDAADRRVEVNPITVQVDHLSTDDAYAIQAALLELRLARGEVLVGAKLGLTSRAKQEQMGVTEPVYGWLTDRTILATDDVPLDQLIHPRVEPEIVFTLAEDLSGPDVTAADVLHASGEVLGGIEVIDSRYEAFKFTLADVIADNTSGARVRLASSGMAPGSADLTTLGCSFDLDGVVTGTATGAALLGDPAGCVALLVRHLDRYGRKLEAGWTVLAGALTDARPLAAGAVARARYSHLATVTAIGA